MAANDSQSKPEEYTVTMYKKSPIEHKFKMAYLLSLKKTESTLILAVCATVLSVGFLFSTGSNINYALIYELAHRYIWAGLFAAYAFIKYMSIWTNIDYRVILVNCFIGLWAWLYLVLSFIVFDTTAVAPTEFLLLIPIIIETWLMLSVKHKQLGR